MEHLGTLGTMGEAATLVIVMRSDLMEHNAQRHLRKETEKEKCDIVFFFSQELNTALHWAAYASSLDVSETQL